MLIGDGPEREWLARRLPSARFTGPLQTGDLTIALPTLDVLVHPGEHETDCHALREAAASGVPSVAPRSGGAADVVRHLETGSSTTRPTAATCAGRSRRSQPTGIAACSARPHATSRSRAPGSMPSTSW